MRKRATKPRPQTGSSSTSASTPATAIRESGNVFGGAVNIDARVAAASAPSEVLVSETVRSLAPTSAGVSFEDRGEHTLRGIAEPQRLFAVVPAA